MNPFKMTKQVLKEAISEGAYEITGILETGELTIAIVSETERIILDRIINSPKDEAYETIKRVYEEASNETEEIYKVYEQLIAEKEIKSIGFEPLKEQKNELKDIWWKNQIKLRGKIK